MKRLTIIFHLHVASPSRDSMITGIAAYGRIEIDETHRVVMVEVTRQSKLEGLTQQLAAWNRFGFLTWTSDDE